MTDRTRYARITSKDMKDMTGKGTQAMKGEKRGRLCRIVTG